jgi:hypothetical protein
MGQASQPVNLIPVFFVTTALATSAAVVALNTYSDQDGNSTTGTRNFTFPSATTAVASAFIPFLETGDSAVRDITNISCSVAATAGVCTVFGLELLECLSTFNAAQPVAANSGFEGFHPPPFNHAVATSGTANVYDCIVSLGQSSTNTVAASIMVVRDA